MTQHSVSEIYSDSQAAATYDNGSGITIEKDVPLPAKESGLHSARAARVPKYPIRDMLPGNSIFLPGYTYKKSMSVVQMGRKALPGSRWTARATNEGCRIWRVS